MCDEQTTPTTIEHDRERSDREREGTDRLRKPIGEADGLLPRDREHQHAQQAAREHVESPRSSTMCGTTHPVSSSSRRSYSFTAFAAVYGAHAASSRSEER